MSTLDQQFEKAAKDVFNMKKKPNNDELLELYALYKQGTIGDCKDSRPGILDIKGRYKWDKWNSLNGMAKDEAKAKYVKLVESLISKYGL